MTTKRKTAKTKTTTTKRSPQWNEYFKAAITGLAMTIDTGDFTDESADVTDTISAARAVKTAERIADIATARNS